MADFSDLTSGIGFGSFASFVEDNDLLGTQGSGSFPTDAESLYKKYIENFKKKLWYIDGENWDKTFGHRFSMVYLDPKKGNDINKVLSLDPLNVAGKVGGLAGGALGAAGASALGGLAAGAVGAATSSFGLSPLAGALNTATSLAGSFGVPINDTITAGAELLFPNFKHFTLPIPPQSMTVRPIFPSRITPTMSGVVEEVSDVKLWTISMSGTMGIAPSQQDPNEKYEDGGFLASINPFNSGNDRSGLAKSMRDTIETTGLLSGKFADQQQTYAKLAAEDAASAAKQAAEDAEVGLGSFTNANAAKVLKDGEFNESPSQSFLPPLPYYFSGVNNLSNGFVESHELQKFFYIYHALKGRHPKSFALIFSTGKTDQAWRCSVKDFILQQSAESPFMFRYKIDLQAWDCRRIQDYLKTDNFNKPFDRFGPGGDLTSVNLLNDPASLQTLSQIYDPDEV